MSPQVDWASFPAKKSDTLWPVFSLVFGLFVGTSLSHHLGLFGWLLTPLVAAFDLYSKWSLEWWTPGQRPDLSIDDWPKRSINEDPTPPPSGGSAHSDVHER